MFTAGRILRNRDGEGTIFGGNRSASTVDDRERRKFRCYVPFVRQSVLATVAGLVVMATGIGVCIAGFYAGYQSQQPQSEAQEINNNTKVFICPIAIP